ncbi:hypothetical protein EK21DRAFT_110637 [Setomelanomma holmii]|uniref:Uncharacterized protein n=1 Tax=Setomelanomma holmii TaxID=210430 RepID=A0A9P4LLN8_9PLEO|nr:hypothetical protein EK21DRAFT_110637 [Setomelanomma holmii]
MNSPEITEETRIRRAAHTLQAAFLIFREATWHTHVLNIKVENKQILVKEDPEMTFRWQGWFSHYPKHQTPDPRDKAAVLTMMATYDVGHMKQLVAQVFEDMDVLLEEVMIDPKPPKRRTVLLYANGTFDPNLYDHWLLRVTSRTTGEQFAVDISGPQYDHHVCCGPWMKVEHQFVEEVLLVKPLGTLEKFKASTAELKSTAGLEADVQAQAMVAFHAAIDIGMLKKGITWAAVLSKADEDYVRHRDKALKVGRRAIDKYVQTTHLTKRRWKAERYEKRHPKAVEEERKLVDEILS